MIEAIAQWGQIVSKTGKFELQKSSYILRRPQKDLGQKMTPVEVRDVLIKSWLLSPENGPQ